MAGGPYDELERKLGTPATVLKKSAHINKLSSSESIHKTIATYICNSSDSLASNPQIINLYKINRKGN